MPTAFVQAACEEGNGSPVPDGKYDVTVQKAEIVRSQTTNNPMLKWTLHVDGPQHEGRLLWKNNVISPDTLQYLKGDLNIAGLKLEKLSDLPGHLGELLDVRIKITKKTVGDYERVYFNRRIADRGVAPAKGLTDYGLGRF